MEWSDAAILRQCRRCKEWLGLGQYADGAYLCRGCASWNAKPVTNYIGVSRGLVITEKGHAALRELERVAS